MVRIAPSLLACDFARLAEEIASVASADLLHLDVMDGQFVPNLSFGVPVVQSLRSLTALPLECHLMVNTPERLIEAFRRAGADRIIVHAEATLHLDRLLQEIGQSGAQAGVALNPATPPEVLEYVLHACQSVLVMTVNPGFGGQAFLSSTLPKISRLRAMGYSGPITVDGGIDAATAALCAERGATDLVAGTSVFGQPDRARAIDTLRKAAAPFDTGHVY